MPDSLCSSVSIDLPSLASDVALAVQALARAGRYHGDFSAFLFVIPVRMSSEGVQITQTGSCPVACDVLGEVVRVEFDVMYQEAGLLHDLSLLVKHECFPAIEGVGDVSFENRPKGFVVVSLDKRQEVLGHSAIPQSVVTCA